ncbi:hypothetical protein GCK32_020399, partial [Trichostrongylus colubriformis]
KITFLPGPMQLRLTHIGLIATFAAVVYYTDAQALNDPITQYIEGRLGNRRIFWCPSGYGYLAYCPQPTDWDNYNWCCTWPYMGSWKPSCCPFAIPTGAVVAIIIAAIVLLAGKRITNLQNKQDSFRRREHSLPMLLCLYDRVHCFCTYMSYNINGLSY